jgi:hypothetical protein
VTDVATQAPLVRFVPQGDMPISLIGPYLVVCKKLSESD